MRHKTTVSAANMESNIKHESVGKEQAGKMDSRCRIHIHSRRFRLADPDGISGKAAIDGIVHAGILSNDTAKEISEVTYSQEKIKKPDIEETIITIKGGVT